MQPICCMRFERDELSGCPVASACPACPVVLSDDAGTYDDAEGEHSLSVAVDERDVDLLIKQCERALKKSKTAQAQLKEKAGLDTLIPGAD